ncbi:MAG: TetR/AcrR family transcriptional regulator [Lachnospiraceae bacterium]|nr:TetR/AcrR family transcriptional regulator [Lachnospiraceae bacterium]
MGKLELNKQLKKDALLNTAFDLFTTKGINKTSISEIVDRAGVAKGTFYLYFSDKYDIRNKLIAHKASQVFRKAERSLAKTKITSLEEKIIFIVDHIIDQLSANKSLLNFISKNLSWGIFKSVLISNTPEEGINFLDIYTSMFQESDKQYENPEILVYMIVELVSSTSYSSILYDEPVPIAELKPYIFNTIREMMRSMEVS